MSVAIGAFGDDYFGSAPNRFHLGLFDILEKYLDEKEEFLSI